MVTSYRKSSYLLERDRWRLNEKPLIRDKGDSAMDKLLKLKDLKDKNVITEEEYNLKKIDLLKQI